MVLVSSVVVRGAVVVVDVVVVGVVVVVVVGVVVVVVAAGEGVEGGVVRVAGAVGVAVGVASSSKQWRAGASGADCFAGLDFR